MHKLRKALVVGGIIAAIAVGTQASPASAQAACSIDSKLVQGQRGSNEVRCLQIALDAAGVEAGPVDGYFGPVTRAAVAQYQAAHGLVVDGWVGSQTGGSLEIWRAPAAKAKTTQRSTSQAAPTGAPYRGSTGGVYLPAYARTVLAQGRCNWLAPHLAAAGLPVGTFMAISARESGCAVNGVHVNNRTDLSTSRFGLNFKGSMPSHWAAICGVSDYRVPGVSVTIDAKCAAAAYHRSGLAPWAVG